MKTGRLILIPNIIYKETEAEVIPSRNIETISGLDYFLVENIRTARRFISSLQRVSRSESRKTIEDMQFNIVDKNTSMAEVARYMEPVKLGRSAGVISESGLPGIADPGSLAVAFAHRNRIPVVPLSGPSSIFMALMSSGFNGQDFHFHGYLPIEKKQLTQRLKEIEFDANQKGQTQIFIETPYRNDRLLDLICNTLGPETHLCIAVGLTGANESVITMKVSEWRNWGQRLGKTPAVFLLGS